jgi:hypothetical protein
MKTKRILGLALLTIGSASLRSAAATDLWLHIRVDEPSEGSKVNVNLPFSLLRTAMPSLPAETLGVRELRVDKTDLSAAELRRIWHQLAQGEDATYVTVRHGKERVLIAKRGAYLVMQSHDAESSDRQDVEVKLPIRVIEALLSGNGDELNLTAALEALAESGEGELVTVNSDRDTVHIWVDHQASSR